LGAVVLVVWQKHPSVAIEMCGRMGTIRTAGCLM